METAGHTPVLRLPELEERYGLRRVEVKDESVNPTGTYKDRRSIAIVRSALRHDIRKLVLISAGNAAYSLAHFATPAGIEVVSVMDEDADPIAKEVLREKCWKVVDADLSSAFFDSQRLQQIARDTPEETVRDVTNGYSNAYRSIVEELTEPPDTIIVPMGSGEAMVGILRGVRKRGWKTRVIGAASHYQDKLRTDFHPYDKAITNLVQHRPYMTYFGIQSQDAEIASRPAPGGIRAEPSARLVYGVLASYREHMPSILGDHVLLINSGCGKLLEEMEERKERSGSAFVEVA